MITYLIKSLPANTTVDSVELECTRKRDNAILLAKQYAKLYYKDTIVVEKYNDLDYIETIWSTYGGK